MSTISIEAQHSRTSWPWMFLHLTFKFLCILSNVILNTAACGFCVITLVLIIGKVVRAPFLAARFPAKNVQLLWTDDCLLYFVFSNIQVGLLQYNSCLSGFKSWRQLYKECHFLSLSLPNVAWRPTSSFYSFPPLAILLDLPMLPRCCKIRAIM